MKPKILYEGKYIRLMERDGWEYLERVRGTGVVMILALTEDMKVILTEQMRPAVNKNVIEFPAGLVGDEDCRKGESSEDAARRELVEETGYYAHDLIHVSSGPLSAGSSSGILDIFLAEKLEKRSEGGGDETENITVHEVNFSEVDDWLTQRQNEGALIDPRIYAGLYWLSQTDLGDEV